MWITAAVLAEICSALPLSGSIYIWAAEAAGPKYARFVAFIVAWWAATAWMTFGASNCQTTANYLLSLLPVWGYDFPGGISNDNVKWRALVWAVSEGLFVLAIILNYLPLNGTGAPPAWNWILGFLFTAGTLTGFDASGHIAEETKNASVVAARGIFSSAIATGTFGFITTIVFLFCTPDIDTWFSLSAPQPFVLIYSMALGRGGATFMTLLAVVGLILNTSIAVVAASRLIFAIARDGVLPLSGWIGQVTPDGRPRNAVTVMYIFGASILCVILPSSVAFTSLVSAAGIPTIAAYGLIALLRLTMTPNGFKSTKFSLGKFARPLRFTL
ncbi:gamma-aminobutyric acid transporter [Rhizoctonia solani AG-1 IA]|uniref:Gamma-aminobutyric acid transporter n=1 Tax=Thanatephorus cucumeris (strain AG1-IA) TaxID=983506 RepID=L8WD97_THACA|nr:gamma-aminobutyric acid transporter [Rhizoctonia solani AG-1 IA]